MKSSIKLIMGIMIIGMFSFSTGDVSFSNAAADFSILGSGNPSSVLPPM